MTKPILNFLYINILAQCYITNASKRVKKKATFLCQRYVKDKIKYNYMFQHLIQLAKSKIRTQESSGRITCGQVSAAIETSLGNLYSGVCIDSACSLGICAERNAIGTMVTESEFQITKLVCIKNESFILPCGACLELILQLHPENNEAKVLINSSGESKMIKELLPQWWGNT